MLLNAARNESKWGKYYIIWEDCNYEIWYAKLYEIIRKAIIIHTLYKDYTGFSINGFNNFTKNHWKDHDKYSHSLVEPYLAGKMPPRTKT